MIWHDLNLIWIWFDCFFTTSADPSLIRCHQAGLEYSCQACEPFSFDGGSRRQRRSTASTAWWAGHGLQGCEIIQSHDTVWRNYNVLQYDQQYSAIDKLYSSDQMIPTNWNSIWHSIWHYISHTFWQSIWHIFRHSMRRSISHIFWQYCSHSTWYLSGNSLCSTSYLHLFWQSIWHSTWHTFRQSIWHSMWYLFLHSIWHSIWYLFSHSIWHSFCHPIWCKFADSLWSRSGKDHCDLELAVRVRQGPLWSWACCSGPVGTAAITSLQLRSGEAEEEEEEE